MQREPRCIGLFYDMRKMRTVRLDLGIVSLRNLNSYHAAPSVAEVPCQSLCEAPQAACLSRVEGAAPYELNAEEFNSGEFNAETERTALGFAGAPDSAENEAEYPTNPKGQNKSGSVCNTRTKCPMGHFQC